MSQRLFFVNAMIALGVAAAVVAWGVLDADRRTLLPQGRWLEAMRYLPQDPVEDFPEVQVVDYAQWRKALRLYEDVPFPLNEYFSSVDPPYHSATLDRADDVDLMVTRGRPFSHRIFAGRFTGESTRRSLDAMVSRSPTLPAFRDLERGVFEHSYNGQTYFAGGPIFNTRRMAQASVGGHVLRVAPLNDDGPPPRLLTDMLDVAAGRRPSTAEEERFGMLARAAERLELIEASLIGEPYTLSRYERGLRREYGNSAVDGIDRQTLLLPYRSFAAGWGIDGQGVFNGVVILNASAADAEANAARLRQRLDAGVSFRTKQPWRESVRSAEIWSEGNMTVAKLYTSQQTWRRIINDLDNLWMAP